MKKVLLGAAVAMLTMVFAAPALANDPSTGWLEICKQSDPAGPVTGPFTYTVNGSMSVTVQTGTCSAPFQVPSGTATVVETAVPFAQVTGITTIPATRLNSADLATGTADVSVPAGDISATTTVTYQNKEVTGFVEVCKKAETGSNLTGSFTFTITGAMGFSQQTTVPVGACSNSIQVPAGQVHVAETGDAATYVTAITAQPSSALHNADLTNASADLDVAAGDVSAESIITFTNSTSTLKICKAITTNGDLPPIAPLTPFPFTANGTAVTVPAGTCEVVPVFYRAGTTVNIAEGVVPGTQVASILAEPSGREVPGSNNPAARTESVVLGPGETVVTYTNQPAPPGTLKICKNAGPGVAAGSMWSFTLAGLTGTIAVPAGSCNIVGPLPFNSTQTITEAATPGFVVTSIVTNPADRLVSANPAGRTVSLIIGSGVTEAIYTNAAAPAVPGPPSTGPGNTTSGSTGSSGGSTGSTGGSTGSTGGSTGATGGSQGGKHLPWLSTAYLVKRHHHLYVVLVLRDPSGQACNVLVKEYDKHGHMIGKIRRSADKGGKITLRLKGNAARFSAGLKY